jgi:hypothetical protein
VEGQFSCDATHGDVSDITWGKFGANSIKLSIKEEQNSYNTKAWMKERVSRCLITCTVAAAAKQEQHIPSQYN